MLLSLLVIAGCGADSGATGPAHRRIVAEAGDRQVGRPNQPLATSIAVRLTDENGDPRAGVTVHWSADDGGTIAPITTTDADGRSIVVWILGPSSGVQHAHAMSDGDAPVEFTATATSTTDGSNDNTIHVLALQTPDGSGQTVHPDFVSTPSPWNAASSYLVVTPYPNGDANFENPSIFAGGDRITWNPPAGVRNPIVSPTRGYLSDPDAVYVPDRNELWVYYREVDARNVIRLMTSSDGVHFSAPVTVAQGDNHTIVSPTVVRRSATEWLMWSVDANIGCSAGSTDVEIRRSSNGTDWSAPAKVSLSQPGLSVWHIDVQWIPARQEYWALYNAKTAGSCTTPALFLATSPDGVQWTTYPSPVLAHGAIREFEDVVYRSTFTYDAATDAIDFWYSGARYESPNYVWRSAYQRRTRSDVFAAIRRAAAGALAALAPRAGVPPLRDAP